MLVHTFSNNNCLKAFLQPFCPFALQAFATRCLGFPVAVAFRPRVSMATSNGCSTYYRKLAETHAPTFTQWIADFENAANQPIQGFGDHLRKNIIERDLAYMQYDLHHRHVAVWEENRGGEMVLPARMHTLLTKCTTKGWSDGETLLALGREVPTQLLYTRDCFELNCFNSCRLFDFPARGLAHARGSRLK